MDNRLNDLLERINDFLARWPSAVPLLGLLLILLNFLLQLFPGPGFWFVDANVMLHLGLIVAIIGLLLVNVYRG
jgi:hypothetical protein